MRLPSIRLVELCTLNVGAHEIEDAIGVFGISTPLTYIKTSVKGSFTLLVTQRSVHKSVSQPSLYRQ